MLLALRHRHLGAQALQTLRERRNACAKALVAFGLVALRLGECGVAFARSGQAAVAAAQGFLGLPGAGREVLRQLPGQSTLGAAQAFSRVAEFNLGTHFSRQRFALCKSGLRVRQTQQGVALARVGESLGIQFGFGKRKFASQRVAPRLQRGDVGSTGVGAHGGQLVCKGAAAVVQHVAEGAQVVQPLTEIAVEKLQVAQVLEGLLEFVRGQKRHQVRGVRHFGQCSNAGEGRKTGAGVARVLLDEALHQLAGANGGDRLGELDLFFLETVGCLLITAQGAAVSAQFAHRIRHGNARFQHRGVAFANGAAAGEFGPRHER